MCGYTDVTGNGHRSRNALTAEPRLPVFSQLTLDISAGVIHTGLRATR